MGRVSPRKYFEGKVTLQSLFSRQALAGRTQHEEQYPEIGREPLRHSFLYLTFCASDARRRAHPLPHANISVPAPSFTTTTPKFHSRYEMCIYSKPLFGSCRLLRRIPVTFFPTLCVPLSLSSRVPALASALSLSPRS